MRTAKYVDIRIFMEGHRRFETLRLKADDGTRFTEQGAKMAMSQFVSTLQEKVPGKIFKAIPIKFNQFNVVHEVGQA